MGWVEQAFEDRIALKRGMVALWNAVRDSVGTAVIEYSQRTEGLCKGFSMDDCKAKGRFCIRIRRGEDTSAEVYLDESDDSLMFARAGGDARRVCGYRLRSDRKGLEFFIELDSMASPISVERSCELALAEFMLSPFPSRINDNGNILSI